MFGVSEFRVFGLEFRIYMALGLGFRCHEGLACRGSLQRVKS